MPTKQGGPMNYDTLRNLSTDPKRSLEPGDIVYVSFSP
jgi:hypothetical protein